VRRSLHFVPGGQEKMIAKALTLPADGLILDLEDAVPPQLKPATRPIVRRWLETLDFGGRERWVRMNPIFTEHAVPDLEETIAARPDGYVVPKPRTAEDVRRIAAQLERLEEKHGLPFGSTKLILIATETPPGLLNIGEVAAASPRIAAISWGIEDLSAAMGLPRVRDEAGRYLDIPRYARVMCAVAASAAGVEVGPAVLLAPNHGLFLPLRDSFVRAGDRPGDRREAQERTERNQRRPDASDLAGVLLELSDRCLDDLAVALDLGCVGEGPHSLAAHNGLADYLTGLRRGLARHLDGHANRSLRAHHFAPTLLARIKPSEAVSTRSDDARALHRADDRHDRPHHDCDILSRPRGLALHRLLEVVNPHREVEAPRRSLRVERPHRVGIERRTHLGIPPPNVYDEVGLEIAVCPAAAR